MNPLSDVKGWLYHLGDIRSDDVKAISESAADLAVIDYAHDGQIFTPEELEELRGANDKLMVSYISIGQANSFRDYWKPEWNDNPPDFLGEPDPYWPDANYVKYWDPEWKDIIYDWVDDIIEAGFNGLYYDIIDAFAHWEKVAPRDDDFYRQEMIKFVTEIRTYANNKLEAMGDDRTFTFIGQNGESLADYPEYLDVIDGIGKEDLFYYYRNGEPENFTNAPEGWTTESKRLLEKAEAAGVEVMVVEYIPPEFTDATQAELAEIIAYLNEQEIPLYVSKDRDLDGVFDVYFLDEDNVISGTPGSDVLNGSDEDELFYADSGDDIVDGGAGNDTINGGAGNDLLIGGDGIDYLRGDDGLDTVLYSSSETGVSVYLNLGKTISESGNDYLTSIENVIGSSNDDRLVGTTDTNVLQGGAGNDIIKGKGGDDTLFGAEGNDKIIGGAGADVINGGAGSDTLISLGGNDTLDGDAGDDFIYGGTDSDFLFGDTGNDKLRGNRGDDTMGGGEGNDDLRGGGGNDLIGGDAGDDFILGGNGSDTIFGDAGNDVLTGGLGGGVGDDAKDTFQYKLSTLGGGGFDRIKDFEDGTDVIDLSTFGFTDFVDVDLLASNAGDDMRIDFGDGNVLYIENFQLADFDASDVIL